MPELKCRVLGEALVPLRDQDREAIRKMPRGASITVRIDGPRNAARHRLLFAIVKTAFDLWPGRHPFRPLDTEHLRKRLLCEAGHETRSSIMTVGSDTTVDRALQAFVNAHIGKGEVFFDVVNGVLIARHARSISYRACDEPTFKRVLDRVIEVASEACGLPVDEVKREVGRAAA